MTAMSMVKIVMSFYIFTVVKTGNKLLREKALPFASDNCRLGIDVDGFKSDI